MSTKFGYVMWYNHVMKSGVYKIVCGTTNTIYIGQSKHVIKRFQQHQHLLRKGTHPNTHLQAAWKKYGAEDFTFNPLVFDPDLENLDKIEQETFDIAFDSGVPLFNQRKITSTNKGVKFCQETRNQISIAATRQFGTSEAREKHSRAYHNPYLLVSPTGEVFTVVNLTAFAKEHGLHGGSICALAKDQIHSHNGWTNPLSNLPPKTSYILSDKDKDSICLRYSQGEGAKELAQEFGVCRNSVLGLLRRRDINAKQRGRRKR